MTSIDLNGTWLYGGLPGPKISAGPARFIVDMSAYHRPTAFGSIVDNATIRVTFPDDATFTGQLVAPDTIRWSNGSAWMKAVEVPRVIQFFQDEAVRDVSHAGLVAQTRGFSGKSAWVQSESPAAGSPVARGSIVTLTMHAPPLP